MMKLDDDVEMATEAEMIIARLATEYLTLPLTAGITSYSNLITGLINKDYWKISRTTGVCIDGERVYADMVRLYGNETVERVFGREIARGVMVRLGSYKTLLPDRYVLIQGLIGMSTKEMLGDEIEDRLKLNIQKMSERSQMQSLKIVVRELELKEWEVRMLCRYYSIEPFWMEKGKGKNKVAKTGKLVIMVDERELDEMKDVAKRMGFRNVGDFVMGCVRCAKKC